MGYVGATATESGGQRFLRAMRRWTNHNTVSQPGQSEQSGLCREGPPEQRSCSIGGNINGCKSRWMSLKRLCIFKYNVVITTGSWLGGVRVEQLWDQYTWSLWSDH